eukprot:CAMPEP_0202451498 /NCGR_PEP_ID=MMETSP1360-20130828/9921_1 /ASSEMBLY_ACC=CAM_ASM_000848 /TAXON_ID=515479 /ORGANISM="Licmophora paradoxa, Strain CCMP2313" /LENGTH=192 /DNA_ID=CAMNT_0049070083 /DNA_START=321 /DNA_END=899 /DNA_ORIENTATION=-
MPIPFVYSRDGEAPLSDDESNGSTANQSVMSFSTAWNIDVNTLQSVASNLTESDIPTNPTPSSTTTPSPSKSDYNQLLEKINSLQQQLNEKQQNPPPDHVLMTKTEYHSILERINQLTLQIPDISSLQAQLAQANQEIANLRAQSDTTPPTPLELTIVDTAKRRSRSTESKTTTSSTSTKQKQKKKKKKAQE